MNNKAPKNSNAEKDIKKSRVALFCIAAILIFYIGANFLKGLDLFSKKTYYYAVFDNVGGLLAGNPVFVNGYKIGKVTDVKMISDNPVKICTEMLIMEDIDIPEDSKFVVAPKDLLGGNIMNLMMGTSSRFAKNGDTLACSVIQPLSAGIDDMKFKINNILSSVDTIGLSLKNVLKDDDGAKNLAQTLKNIEQITGNLDRMIAQNEAKVGRLVTDLTTFSNTLKSASPELKNVISNFNAISDTLAKANIAGVIYNANKTISDIDVMVRKVNDGQGDIGQLMNNDTLYKNLEAATNNLNLLLKDIKQNPGRYVQVSVFGKKDKNK